MYHCRWKVSELAKVLKVPEKPIVFMKPTTSYIVEGESIKVCINSCTIAKQFEDFIPKIFNIFQI